MSESKVGVGEEVDFKVPKMGESITEGNIISWAKNEGDYFEEGETLVEIGTDKVDNEVPAPFDGQLIAIKADADDVVEIGQVIATIKSVQIEKASGEKESAKSISADKNAGETNKAQTKTEQALKKSASAKSNQSDAYYVPDRSNNFYSPLVLQIAKEHHISFEELARIPATGANDRLRKSDIYKYLDSGRPAQFAQPVDSGESNFKLPDLKFDKGEGKVVEMDRMRRMIADHMVFSKHVSPHVTAYSETDLTDLFNWRQKEKDNFLKENGVKLTFTPVFIKAITKAIESFPMINSSLDDKNIIVKEHVNIGMATALESGNLIVPVIKNAHQMDVASLAKEVNRLTEKARNNTLTSNETKGGTFTLSNVGTFGSLMGTPIINQPEAAILATGFIKKRPEVVERNGKDEIEIRHMMYLSLSFDHRIVDGFLAGSFLKKMSDLLEDHKSIID
jgi:2-oxoglutarate dehydrogenase E2 component (dihydrolipoamide succinyltransferase)